MMLKIDSITMCFGGLTALDQVSFDVEENTIHGIIGPNGSGKTTLFNVINGIYTPTSGKVYFQGEDITNFTPPKVAKIGISRTFQLLRIFPSMSVLDNLIVAQGLHEKTTVLDAVVHSPRMCKEYQAMSDKAMDMLKVIGLESKTHNSAASISIGQRRMLQLAMGVISKPKLLLLDECAAGLDPANIDKLIELLKLFRAEYGITVLMIEHIMNVVMNVCERLTVLDYGVKIFEGEPYEVQNNEKVIEAYLGSEA
ncbi:MAG: ABC transporter ATP-binding protein [Anaerolineaceae bacterium]|nr:ABC transporter ATP-binding protein [Anaerolineaceae bacterium]